MMKLKIEVLRPKLKKNSWISCFRIKNPRSEIENETTIDSIMKENRINFCASDFFLLTNFVALGRL